MFGDIYKINAMKSTEQNSKISALPENTVVAMAYVPFQQDTETYSPEQGISCGTMFPVLNKPFIGCGGNKND